MYFFIHHYPQIIFSFQLIHPTAGIELDDVHVVSLLKPATEPSGWHSIPLVKLLHH